MGGLTVTEDRVIGPPGTGKTTFLTQVITHEASQRGSDAVVAVSHTRAAAAELAGRNAPIDRDNIATLHALAYRADEHLQQKLHLIGQRHAGERVLRERAQHHVVRKPHKTHDHVLQRNEAREPQHLFVKGLIP